MKFKLINTEMSGVTANYIVVNPQKALQYEIPAGTLLIDEDNTCSFRLVTSTTMERGLAGISKSKLDEFGLKAGQELNLIPAGVEGVTRIIRRKMEKRTLTDVEIETFISSLNTGMLTPSHIAAFGTAVQINGMHASETTAVARSIYKYSKSFSHRSGKKVVDKHSIGGIAGNRITPIMVPIISAAGLVIPKISTRAITSPAGTVDTLETIMDPNLSFEEAQEVLEKVGACMVNGETVELGAVADKFLSAVKSVKIDPKEMMIASILAKKKAAGAEYVIIDLPTGKGSKLPTRKDARRLAYDFQSIGEKLGMNVEAVISPGDKPIGNMIGPSLEMKECLLIMEGKKGSDLSLKRKALNITGLIFEAIGYADRGKGISVAAEFLESGRALNKLREITEAQGGDAMVSSKDISDAPYTHKIVAERDDIVYSLDSYNIGMVARAAGAPSDKMAGIILNVDRGETIKKGDVIVEIHSHSEGKLSDAIELMKTAAPINLERTVLEHIKAAPEELD